MSRWTLVSVAVAVAVSATAVRAQDHGSAPKQSTDCTFCDPYIFLEGAALIRPDELVPVGGGDKTTGLVRALIEIGTPLDHVGIFTNVEFAPKDSYVPRMQYGARVWMLPRFAQFNVTLGAGATHRFSGQGEEMAGSYRVRGWGEATAEYALGWHSLALYAGAGTPFGGGAKPEFQIGVRHNLAPYTFHVTH